jgi:mRNA interferase RelE/StbE
MRKYHIDISKKFKKNFYKLDSNLQKKCLFRLKELEKNPFKNCTKLMAMSVGQFRIRIGNYRIRYDVKEDVVRIHSIKHRKEVYRK